MAHHPHRALTEDLRRIGVIAAAGAPAPTSY
jgi:hypothetical protein